MCINFDKINEYVKDDSGSKYLILIPVDGNTRKIKKKKHRTKLAILLS